MRKALPKLGLAAPCSIWATAPIRPPRALRATSHRMMPTMNPMQPKTTSPPVSAAMRSGVIHCSTPAMLPPLLE